MEPDTRAPSATPLEVLLRRKDLWRGDSMRFLNQAATSTGFAELDKALLQRGWPHGSLVEVCQPTHGYSEWCLFTPALRLAEGYVVLLNPPAMPLAQRAIQAGLDLNRLLLVHAADKTAFIKSFVELARTPMCQWLLAWQPHSALSYTELRKCLLAGGQQSGLRVLFRSTQVEQHASPAALRLALTWQAEGLQLRIFKQKGLLQKRTQTVLLPVPAAWQPTHEAVAVPQPTVTRSLFEP